VEPALGLEARSELAGPEPGAARVAISQAVLAEAELIAAAPLATAPLTLTPAVQRLADDPPALEVANLRAAARLAAVELLTHDRPALDVAIHHARIWTAVERLAGGRAALEAPMLFARAFKCLVWALEAALATLPRRAVLALEATFAALPRLAVLALEATFAALPWLAAIPALLEPLAAVELLRLDAALRLAAAIAATLAAVAAVLTAVAAAITALAVMMAPRLAVVLRVGGGDRRASRQREGERGGAEKSHRRLLGLAKRGARHDVPRLRVAEAA